MDPFIGTIMPVAFGFAPRGWALCDGQLMSISQNQALFSLLGTRFGGNGIQTFALPDLRGRTPRGFSQGSLGVMNGQEAVTLTTAQLPGHSHLINATQSPGGGRGPADPAGKLLATATQPGGLTLYGQPVAPVALSADNLTPAGGGQAHANMQPSTVVNFIIALVGIYPSPA
ncbi:MAG: phage tail protein [Paracoccaceae bacterium]|nr:phage tail protein [Paracoccaceae bacterium]